MSGRMLYVELSEIGQKTLQELLDMSPSTDIRSLFEDSLIHFAALKRAQKNGVAWVIGAAVNPDNDDSEESVVLDIPSVFQLQAQNVAKKSEITVKQSNHLRYLS